MAVGIAQVLLDRRSPAPAKRCCFHRWKEIANAEMGHPGIPTGPALCSWAVCGSRRAGPLSILAMVGQTHRRDGRPGDEPDGRSPGDADQRQGWRPNYLDRPASSNRSRCGAASGGKSSFPVVSGPAIVVARGGDGAVTGRIDAEPRYIVDWIASGGGSARGEVWRGAESRWCEGHYSSGGGTRGFPAGNGGGLEGAGQSGGGSP